MPPFQPSNINLPARPSVGEGSARQPQKHKKETVYRVGGTAPATALQALPRDRGEASLKRRLNLSKHKK